MLLARCLGRMIVLLCLLPKRILHWRRLFLDEVLKGTLALTEKSHSSTSLKCSYALWYHNAVPKRLVMCHPSLVLRPFCGPSFLSQRLHLVSAKFSHRWQRSISHADLVGFEFRSLASSYAVHSWNRSPLFSP